MNTLNFKWNPFTLKGEAPASLRFFPDSDLEFATKEDLEFIKNDPNLSKIHQSMTAGVNKKFQSWAEENKQLKQQILTLQKEIAELDVGLREWEDFFTQHKQPILKAIQGEEGDVNTGSHGRDRSGSGGKGNDDRYDILVGQFNQAALQFTRRLDQLGNMLNLSLQLNDIIRKNPKVDAMKVLDTALKEGFKDLNMAYNKAYEEDLLNEKVEAGLKTRVDEELAKRKTDVETGSGAVPINFKLPSELPKSMGEAGQQFLEERAKEASKP